MRASDRVAVMPMNPETSPSERSRTMLWRPDDRHGVLLGAIAWVLIVLMIVPEGFDYQGLTTIGPPSSGGSISRMLWIGLFSLSAIVVFWRGPLAILLARAMNPFLLLFAALALASVIWSIDPTLSLRRLFRMGTMVTVASAFVLMGWHARRFQNVVRPALTVLLIGSIAFGLAFPSLAIHQEASSELAGAWRGLANHKNGLGDLACLGLIFWLHAWLAGEVKFAPALGGAAVAATCLLLSHSSTSLAAAVFVTFVLVAVFRTPAGRRPYLPALVVLVVSVLGIYGLAILDLVPGLRTLMAPVSWLTSKDLTLTGRTAIWDVLADHIRFHPLLGTGYAAYWTAGAVAGTDSYAYIWRMGSFYPGSAHNGYLDVLNDLGWVGLSCLFGYLFVFVRQCLQLLSIDRSQSLLYLALFLQQALTNLSETHWFSVLSIDFVIMTLATLALARGLLEHRLRLAFGAPDFIGAGPGQLRQGFAWQTSFPRVQRRGS